MTEAEAIFKAPLSPSEKESAAYVFDQYERLDRVKAWKMLALRARDTSRPFSAYVSAHSIAAELTGLL